MHRNKLEVLGSLNPFVPGYCGWVRFPQHERSIFESKREILRNIWNSCFFAKDFEGAMQVSLYLHERIMAP
jgi:hypothetical protein